MECHPPWQDTPVITFRIRSTWGSIPLVPQLSDGLDLLIIKENTSVYPNNLPSNSGVISGTSYVAVYLLLFYIVPHFPDSLHIRKIVGDYNFIWTDRMYGQIMQIPEKLINMAWHLNVKGSLTMRFCEGPSGETICISTSINERGTHKCCSLPSTLGYIWVHVKEHLLNALQFHSSHNSDPP